VTNIIRGTGMQLEEADYNRPTDYTMAGPGMGGVLRAIAAAGGFFPATTTV
jgi:hypothetical protein